MADYIKIHPADHVAVALAPLPSGTTVTIENKKITLLADIPQSHKFSLVPLEKGTQVIKYGSSIGLMKESVPAGTWIHTHNMRTGLSDLLTFFGDFCKSNKKPYCYHVR